MCYILVVLVPLAKRSGFFLMKRIKQIIRYVKALFAFADSIEANVAAAREKTEKLRQSILAKEFSGKLVETEAEIARIEGRDYETAEVLLERIKAEKRKKDKKK